MSHMLVALIRAMAIQFGFPSAQLWLDLCVEMRSPILIHQILSGVVIFAPIILSTKCCKQMLLIMSRRCTSVFLFVALRPLNLDMQPLHQNTRDRCRCCCRPEESNSQTACSLPPIP